jgi:predicted transcriptional regulator YheO
VPPCPAPVKTYDSCSSCVLLSTNTSCKLQEPATSTLELLCFPPQFSEFSEKDKNANFVKKLHEQEILSLKQMYKVVALDLIKEPSQDIYNFLARED